jgi:hypothetical protein
MGGRWWLQQGMMFQDSAEVLALVLVLVQVLFLEAVQAVGPSATPGADEVAKAIEVEDAR